ncbi:MAG: hypothetical protein KAH57_01165 [Thermoplasmata archaeon]|nr:hypothetical protein [Thermoplasmata archaeon]
MTSYDPMRDHYENTLKRERNRKKGKIMLIPGVVLILLSIAMPFVNAMFGLLSWPVCFSGGALFFGGLITIVTNLKKKPPTSQGMGLDEL